MTRKTTDRPIRLADLLIEGLKEAVAIKQGRSQPARVHRYTVRDVAVTPPPHYSAAQIKRLRKRFGLSQALFAKVLNVSAPTVRSWEQGARKPHGPTLRLIQIAANHPETVLENLAA